MTSGLILVVCAANVCRSPMAEMLLRRGLEGVPGVRVASAGTRARQGTGICQAVATWADDEFWRTDSAAHRSRRAVSELLEQADLILVSSRDVRADVVLSAPEVRGRTYTLRDAAHLGEEFDPLLQPRRAATVASYVMHLDRARVVRGVAEDGRRRWGRARRVGGSDIVDGHGKGRREHQDALVAVAEATATIVRQLGGEIA